MLSVWIQRSGETEVSSAEEQLIKGYPDGWRRNRYIRQGSLRAPLLFFYFRVSLMPKKPRGLGQSPRMIPVFTHQISWMKGHHLAWTGSWGANLQEPLERNDEWIEAYRECSAISACTIPVMWRANARRKMWSYFWLNPKPTQTVG